MIITLAQDAPVLNHKPILNPFDIADMKSIDVMSDDASCLSGPTAYSASPADECFDINMWETPSCEMPKNPDFTFWMLPPELRTMVYRELLLSDSAFRLGHHGPYSHEPRRDLFPQILRTCPTAFIEASEVLYGDNTFYLGPIGHKPTYSASFITSIGSHNACKIRTLVAHCTHLSSLSERYMRSWITSFGLNVDRLKILAISFHPMLTGESMSSRSSHNMPQMIRHHAPPLPQHQQPQSAFLPWIGPPGGPFSLLANVVLPGSGPPPLPAAAVVGSSPATTPSIERDGPEKQQMEYALMESRLQNWLTRASKTQVTKWVQIKNTDLRAGDRWLLYVCPTVQVLRSMRF